MGSRLTRFVILLSAVAMPLLAHAQSELCNTGDACGRFPTGLRSLALTPEEQLKFVQGSTRQVKNITKDTCWFIGEDVHFHIPGSRREPVLWGHGRLTAIQTENNQIQGVFTVTESQVTDALLAPECFGECESIVDELPTPSANVSLVDLRTQTRAMLDPIPGANNVPFPPGTPASAFNFARLAPPGAGRILVLIPGTNRISEFEIFRLMNLLRQKGYARVWWYYPGAVGLRGFRLPARGPEQLKTLKISALGELDLPRTTFFFVGPKESYFPVKTKGFSITPAFSLPALRGRTPPENPFQARAWPKNFAFPTRMPPRDSTVVVLERDATENYKYQAAEALQSLGYRRVMVLTGGLVALRAAGRTSP